MTSKQELQLIELFLTDPVNKDKLEISSTVYQTVGGFNKFDVTNPNNGASYTVTFKITERN